MMRRMLLLAGICALSLLAQAAAKPNIILLTLDSARGDRMDFLGGKKGLTPRLDALAKQALVFQRAYAQSPLTLTSQATLLSGNYPQTHRVIDQGIPLATSVPYLPAILQAQGYRTAAFVASPELNPRTGQAPGLERGFTTYRTIAAGAEPVLAAATAWLAGNSPGPFFLWVELPEPKALSSASYDAGLRAQDTAAGKLLAELETRKLLDAALVVVVADHGQSLGAHGEASHGIFLYDETIHVPLIVKLPSQNLAGRRLDDRVRLVDVAPTILEVAAVPVPPAMQGDSLLRLARSHSATDQPAYSRTDFPSRDFGWSALESWRSGKYLLVRAPKPELYDLESDPAAAHNLAGSHTAVYDTLAAQMENFTRRLEKQPAASGSSLSSSELQKLASLGYVGLQHSTTRTEATGIDPKDRIQFADGVEQAVRQVESGKASVALPALKKAVQAAPNTYLALYATGLAEIALKDYKAAIQHLHQAIAQVPDSALAQYAMGKALAAAGDWKTAVTHLEIAVPRLPEVADAHALLADAYARTGRADDAKRERSAAERLRAH